MNEEVDYEEDIDATPTQANVKASAPTQKSDHNGIKKKGRGHQISNNNRDEENHRSGVFDNIQNSKGSGPLQSIEGWILCVTNVHPEAQEDDILDKFSEYGTVKNIHVNLDRRTGFVKGYALVEFEEYNDALTAIKELNGKTLLEQIIQVDWAFVKK